MLEKFFNFTPKRAIEWEKIRAKGKTHFILLRGVLGWGLIMFVTLTMFGLCRSPNLFSQILIRNAVICLIGGYIWGAWTWSLTEKIYKKYTDHKPTD